MTYRVISAGLVQNTETGERYQATPDREWAFRLRLWKADVCKYDDLAERVFQRARKRNSWDLYRRCMFAIRASRLPAPMPTGHVMFKTAERRTP